MEAFMNKVLKITKNLDSNVVGENESATKWHKVRWMGMEESYEIPLNVGPLNWILLTY